MRISEDGRTIAWTSADQWIEVISGPSYRRRIRFRTTPLQVTEFELSPDGQEIAVPGHGLVELFSTIDGRSLASFALKESDGIRVAFVGNNHLLIGGRYLTLMDLAKRQPIWSCQVTGDVAEMSLDRSHGLAAIFTAPSRIALHSLVSGRRLATLWSGKDYPSNVVTLGAGKFAAWTLSGPRFDYEDDDWDIPARRDRFVLWSVREGRPLKRFVIPWASEVGVTRDGRYLYTSSSRGSRVWRLGLEQR